MRENERENSIGKNVTARNPWNSFQRQFPQKSKLIAELNDYAGESEMEKTLYDWNICALLSIVETVNAFDKINDIEIIRFKSRQCCGDTQVEHMPLLLLILLLVCVLWILSSYVLFFVCSLVSLSAYNQHLKINRFCFTHWLFRSICVISELINIK